MTQETQPPASRIFSSLPRPRKPSVGELVYLMAGIAVGFGATALYRSLQNRVSLLPLSQPLLTPPASVVPTAPSHIQYSGVPGYGSKRVPIHKEVLPPPGPGASYYIKPDGRIGLLVDSSCTTDFSTLRLQIEALPFPGPGEYYVKPTYYITPNGAVAQAVF